MSKRRRLLMIEPHSDDGVISAGGFLERFRNQFEYHFSLVVASDLPLHHNAFQTREERMDEFERYVEHFKGLWHRGLDKDSDLPLDMDSRLDTYPRRQLVAQIERVIDDVRPHVLMCSGPSFHHDHTAVYEAMIAATRPSARHFPDEIYILENPTYIHATNPLTRFIPDTYVSLTEEELQKKLDCFANFFPSQIRDGKNCLSAEGIRSWARYRGIEARTEYAEAFQTFSRVIS
jgi:LmbE family N-acetylglucosaminyl deacetylase